MFLSKSAVRTVSKFFSGSGIWAKDGTIYLDVAHVHLETCFVAGRFEYHGSSFCLSKPKHNLQNVRDEFSISNFSKPY